MKNKLIYIKLMFIILILHSCNQQYQVIDTKIINGVISAKEEGHRGRISTLPKLYVQSPKEIEMIDIPFSDENLFNIGDTICELLKQF